MDWDDPQWVQAWATVALLVAAVAAGVITLCIYRLESRRDQAREKERRAGQASQVAGWVEWVEDAPNPLARALDRALPGHACILLNSSPLPVYEALLSFWLLGETAQRAGSQHVGVLPPGEKTVGIRRTIMQQWRESGESFTALGVEIRFTDSTGRRWWRGHDGVLIDKGPWKPNRASDDEDAART